MLRDRFGHHQWTCSTVPRLGAWCRTLVEAMVDELDARMWERSRIQAQCQIIAAEENLRDREGKAPPDLRGLPTWKEISSPPAE